MYALPSLSISPAKPKRSMNRLISPGASGLRFKSTRWIVTRRSLKNLSAARVAGEFFKPKICTLTIHCPNISFFCPLYSIVYLKSPLPALLSRAKIEVRQGGAPTPTCRQLLEIAGRNRHFLEPEPPSGTLMSRLFPATPLQSISLVPDREDFAPASLTNSTPPPSPPPFSPPPNLSPTFDNTSPPSLSCNFNSNVWRSSLCAPIRAPNANYHVCLFWNINMIKVEGLTKRYARTVAVDDISFEVEKGQIVGFLGPNGAGKTTTMRVLTCFLPPTSGTATVAGFDVLENPQEVKKRIGYLPETPPLYPEMEVIEYLTFVGQIKGIPATDIKRRADEVIGRCALGDVRSKLIGKLSKGFRQRVGIAQAIIHNPDVLILDEPTSGLDPKQIIEIRELLKALSGDHTIILSTHILSEVEHSCERVIIISQGKLVAQDSVANLTNRLRGSESVAIEVEAAGGKPDPGEVQGRLEQVAGVSRVMMKDSRDGRLTFEVESLQGRHIRAELARSVVNSGWNLSELRAVGLSLEDIFLQLTTAESKEDGDKK